MKKVGKALLALALTLTLGGVLCACGGEKTEAGFNAAAYVEGELEALYHGTFTAGYLTTVGLTEDAATAAYEQNLALEADAFCKTLGVEYPTAALKARLGRLYKDIWAKLDYTVGAATSQGDGSYRVAVTVRPLDIMQQLYKAHPAFLKEFMAGYDGVDTESMTDEEYDTWYRDTFDRAYGVGVTDLLDGLLPKAKHQPQQSLSLRVTRGAGDAYTVNQDDFAALDKLLVDYGDPGAVITPDMKPPIPLPTSTPAPTVAPSAPAIPTETPAP